MRASIAGLCATLVLLSSCGYVGPVLPPSPEIPATITDLAVVERGDKLLLTFTTPPRTTDNLAIRKFSEIQVDIGPAPAPFERSAWEAKARTYSLTLPPTNSADEARAVPMEESIPVSEWARQRVAVMVRTAVRNDQSYSAWSNRIELAVEEPLQSPAVKAEATAAGYRLTWPSAGAGIHYNVLRTGLNDKEAVPIGSSDKNEFVDGAALWDTPYSYQVVAVGNNRESLPSPAVRVNSPDTFPPAVPGDLSVSPTASSIEVSWSRSPDADTAGYNVYRGENGGPMQKQGELQALPAYSDHQLTRGATYRYAVTAVDRKGNESAPSPAVEIASPLQ